MLPRDRGMRQSLGAPLLNEVHNSRVLLIGAGGIGCELLKNLVCCGFGSGANASATQDGNQEQASRSTVRAPGILVIDLDTIDLSNLNRQFLFRKQHIKQPKAIIAKETASHFNPSVRIDAHHASIFDSQYDVDFFESFDLVFNALDNLAARRHVNRMCLAANVVLIESGTTGFMGQVQAIQRGVTECYDCNEKPVQKSFPICTIRSTPSQPIHSIVWAKSYLLPELFGSSEEESTDVVVTNGDNADEVAKLKKEAEALKEIRTLMGSNEFAQEVFNKVFYDDIERLRSMSEMWTSRTAPLPIRFESLCIDKDPVRQGEALARQDQKTWTLIDNLKVFCYSTDALGARIRNGESAIDFDKDDKETLDFVAAAANLRSHIFGIPLMSEWDMKQMAGNIIPAIATSNALTASLCVMQGYKILRSRLPKPSTQNGHVRTELLGGSKMVFLTSRNTERMITSQKLAPPRPDCPVCSPFYAKLALKPANSATLQNLVTLLQARLGLDEFSIITSAGIIYEPDLDDNLEKTLTELNIASPSSAFVTVTDDSDPPKVDLLLAITTAASDAADIDIFPSTFSLPAKHIPEPVAEDQNGDTEVSKKRKRDDELDADDAHLGKKAKANGADENVIAIEDEGAIVLD